MASQHTSDYPTLGEVLRLPAFAGCTVCGGAAGLDRRVSGVNLTDTPLRQVMADFAAARGVICGISCPYSGAAGLQRADRSARTALHMAEQAGTPCVTDDPAGVVRLLAAEPADPVKRLAWETALYLYRYRRT